MCDHDFEANGEVFVCRCEEITEEMIIQAIADGARTIDAIKKRTRAGMGFCQGRTCRRLVARILAEQTGQKLEDIPLPSFRAPVRPVSIDVIVHGGNIEDA